MLHLSHPNDEVAVQVLSFLQTVLYLGNELAQSKIGDLCDHRETIFFQRVQKLLDIMISNLGIPDSKRPKVHRHRSAISPDLQLVSFFFM